MQTSARYEKSTGYVTNKPAQQKERQIQ